MTRRFFRIVLIAAAMAFGVMADQLSVIDQCSREAKGLLAPDPAALALMTQVQLPADMSDLDDGLDGISRAQLPDWIDVAPGM